MKNRSRGFTLMELMVTLSVAAIILGLAAPSFDEFRRNNRLTSTANDLLTAIQMARTEAIKQQQSVSICPTADATVATPDCANAEFSSWVMFLDPNNNCVREAGETVLKKGGPAPTGVVSKRNAGGLCISFAPTGFLQPQAVTTVVPATNILYCDSRGLAPIAGTQSAGRGVYITNTGRSRVARETSGGGIDDLSTWGFVCP